MDSVLDKLAPTAWYHDKKSGLKTTVGNGDIENEEIMIVYSYRNHV